MDTICVYKDKLNEALTLVPSMSQAKRLEAVSYWNSAASHFQKMVNANSQTHDLSCHQSDATGHDSSLDIDYQQQASDINPTVILDSEDFSIGPSEQVNPSASDNIVDLTSDLSPSDTLAGQFQQQSTLSNAPLYDSEYFSSNMIGEMQQQLSNDQDELNHLSTLCSSNSANDTLQQAYMNEVMATDDNCAPTRPLLTVNTCTGNQYQSAHHSNISLNNIVPGTSSCSNLDDMNTRNTQRPINSSVFCPMSNSSIQVTSMSSTGVENSNVICQPSVLNQATHTAQNSNVSNDLVLCPRQPTSTHDIGNGQYDRGPGRPPRPQIEVCQSTSTINMDPCFNMSTGLTNMNRNDLFTQGVRPLQQIQISEQSSTECDYNADSRPRTTFFHQNQQRPDISNANQQQIVYLPSTNMVSSPTQPTCSPTFNILPQQSELSVKMESANEIESCATTSNEQHTCELCGKSGFSTKGNLKRHRKAHAGDKPYQCEHCESKFTEKKSLKIHLRRHTGEKPYKCTVCEKPFSQTGVLKSHMALHLEERKFNCDKCNKAFRQRSQLKLHLMRHDGIKKLECSRCMAKFLTKGDLERHFRIHTGERPYKCNMCEKTFTRQQSLNEHKNRHIGRKPFTCKYCDKSFSEMSASYKHAKVHKKEEQARAIE